MTIRSEDIVAHLASDGKYTEFTENNDGCNAWAFKAHNSNLGRMEFLKITDFDARSRDAVLQEPRCLLAVASQPGATANVVQVYDVTTLVINQTTLFCIQMECVHGPNLETFIRREAIGQQQAVRLVLSILNGLSYLHRQRLLHRDLKPLNIMMDGVHPRITDFGSARYLPENVQSIAASNHAALYSPPEALDEIPSFGFFTDIYQAGMLLHELVNGVCVYEDLHYVTERDLLMLQRRGVAPTDMDAYDRFLLVNKGIRCRALTQTLLSHASPERPYFSDRLKRLVRKATNPRPASRFSSAAEMMRALSQMSLPDWRIVGKDTYHAGGWKGADWIINATPEGVALQKLVATGVPRTIRTHGCKTLPELFQYVERI